MKDYVRAVLIAKDQFWWNKNDSPWRISAYHKWTPPPEKPDEGDHYQPDYWMKRVMDLCTFEIVRNNFGLNFNDLMHLDVSTFEEIEEQVHKMAEEQRQAMLKSTAGNSNTNKELRQALGLNGNVKITH